MQVLFCLICPDQHCPDLTCPSTAHCVMCLGTESCPIFLTHSILNQVHIKENCLL